MPVKDALFKLETTFQIQQEESLILWNNKDLFFIFSVVMEALEKAFKSLF